MTNENNTKGANKSRNIIVIIIAIGGCQKITDDGQTITIFSDLVQRVLEAAPKKQSQ